MDKKLQTLKQKLSEISDIHRAINVLEWDQSTYMPPKGAKYRGSSDGNLSTHRT